MLNFLRGLNFIARIQEQRIEAERQRRIQQFFKGGKPMTSGSIGRRRRNGQRARSNPAFRWLQQHR